MPELPEVETIRRGLRPYVLGRCIASVEIGAPKIFQVDPATLEGALSGQTIHEIGRRGKYLIFFLSRNRMVVHLGMTGQLTLRDPSEPDSEGFLRHEVTGLQRTRQHSPDQHTHFQLGLDCGRTLMYRDVRKFGKVYLLSNQDSEQEGFFAHMGLEPFTSEYELAEFLRRMGARKTRIKSLLLDQRFVAGVGNIYADEALFLSRIHPSRKVYSLRKREKVELFGAVLSVLQKGIDYGGTTLRDYINSDGETGLNQEHLNVYGRNGEPCRDCGTTIEKIVVSQRGTHFCPKCQARR